MFICRSRLAVGNAPTSLLNCSINKASLQTYKSKPNLNTRISLFGSQNISSALGLHSNRYALPFGVINDWKIDRLIDRLISGINDSARARTSHAPGEIALWSSGCTATRRTVRRSVCPSAMRAWRTRAHNDTRSCRVETPSETSAHTANRPPHSTSETGNRAGQYKQLFTTEILRTMMMMKNSLSVGKFSSEKMLDLKFFSKKISNTHICSVANWQWQLVYFAHLRLGNRIAK